jgi:hypothetical protein
MKDNDMEQVVPPADDQTQGEVKSGGSFKGFIDVFHQPSELFERIKHHPKILVPLLGVLILVAVFFVALGDMMIEMQLEMPQVRSGLEMQGAWPPSDEVRAVMKIQTIIGGTLAVTLTPLLAALFAMFFGNFVMAGNARFKQIFSVMLYGTFLFAVGMLVLVPLALAKGSAMVSLSLAALVPDLGPQNVLYVALSKIGVFNIWEIIVVGIGLSIIYDMPRNKGYLLSVLSVGMLSILHIVFTAIGQLFM